MEDLEGQNVVTLIGTEEIKKVLNSIISKLLLQ